MVGLVYNQSDHVITTQYSIIVSEIRRKEVEVS